MWALSIPTSISDSLCILLLLDKLIPTLFRLWLLEMTSQNQQWLVLASHEQLSRIKIPLANWQARLVASEYNH